MRAIIEAIGVAADALINENESDGISIASHVIVHKDRTYVVIGADDEFVNATAAKNILYGAYNNYISTSGVSALWNGYKSSSYNEVSVVSPPVIAIKNEYIIANPPDNLINPASEIIFIDSASPSKSSLSTTDIANR